MARSVEVPIQVQVTIELTGRMLPGTEIAAALAALDPMRPDVIGLNCATGPTEMGEHLRHLSQHARIPISVLPNAGLPSVVDGAHYDLTAEEFVDHQRASSTSSASRSSAAAAAPRPSTSALAERGVRRHRAPGTPPDERASRRSTAPGALDAGRQFLMIGERTNANGSKAFREAMLDADWDTCVAMAKDQVRDGATSSTCASTTWAATAPPTWTRSPALRHPVDGAARARLHRARGARGRAAVARAAAAILNSANLEDGDGPRAPASTGVQAGQGVRRRGHLPAHRRGGPGPHVEWKMRVAHRIHDLAVEHLRAGDVGDLIFDASPSRSPPATTTCARRHRDHRGDPAHQGRAPRRAHDPRRVERVVRPVAGGAPRAQLGVPPRVRQGRARLGDRARAKILPLAASPRSSASVPRPHLRPPRGGAGRRCPAA
jgi:5-methyltetrahydrofolate--homocysteine methyltransferase